jgi:hypothetical protein
MNRRLLPLLVFLLGALPLGAQAPAIVVDQLDCLPRSDNGVIHATISPEVGGADPRAYFQWEEDQDYYYVPMHATGGGLYWAVPPKPDEKNQAVDYYVALVDPQGQVVARSQTLMAQVRDDCFVELTEQQRGAAENLTVGETTFEQAGELVEGFLCDGLVTRIDPLGILRGDERCRACVIAWWDKAGILIPAAAGAVAGGILLSRNDPSEASPVTP